MIDLLILQKYSCLIAIVIVWFALVLYPYLHKDLGYLEETISALSAKKNNVMKVVTFALLTGNFFQMYFILYINTRFNIHFLSLPSLLYLSTGVATFLGTICTAKSNPKIHHWAAIYYFLISPIVIVLIGYFAAEAHSQVFKVSFLLALIYIVSNFLIYLKYKSTSAMFELCCFFVLSIWGIYMTFI